MTLSLSDVGVSFVPLFVSRTGSRGNPALRPFEATQYDATLEWYFAPSSALTVMYDSACQVRGRGL